MASSDTPKVIELHGTGIQHEAVAGGAITPGMLVELQADAVDTVEAHATDGGGGNPSFAIDYYLTGLGIDDAYASGDNVIYRTYAAGSSVYALVAASATAITKAAPLASNGDGTVRIAADGDVVIAHAREAVDNSAGGSAVRIKIEIVNGYALNPATA
jgi:hypothetical protein